MDPLSAVIGGGVTVAIFLVRHFVVRSTNRTDRKEKTKETNNANELEADESFRDSLMRRVELLENKQEKTTEKLTQSLVDNATMKAENESLKGQNGRLRAKVEALTETIAALRSELDALKQQVNGQPQIGTADEPLHVAIEA